VNDEKLLLKIYSEMKENFASINVRLDAQEKIIQEIKNRLNTRETLNGQQDITLAKLQERISDIEERMEEERREKRFWKSTLVGLFINAFLTWLKVIFHR